MVNEETAYKKINFTDLVEIRKIGHYLYKIICKWEKKIKEL
jgi:hypothetical protein